MTSLVIITQNSIEINNASLFNILPSKNSAHAWKFSDFLLAT